MRYLLTSREMKQADGTTIEHFGVSSMVLMEQAAQSVVSVIEEEGIENKTIGIICGPGNNGGDGFAVARILFLKGVDVSVFFVGCQDKMTPECKEQMAICKKYGIPMVDEIANLNGCDILVDAIFGVGLTREVSGVFANVISTMNQMKARKIAIDMPSGVNADDGGILGVGFQADITITFAFEKVGQFLYPGKSYCGQVVLAHIGITKHSLMEHTPQHKMLCEEDLLRLPTAPKDANKGSLGKVLLIAGSEEMAGAAYLSAGSALITGCGMVKVYTHAKNRDIIISRLPEAIVVCYDKFDEKECMSLLSWADVVAIGPGIGQSQVAVSIVHCVMQNTSVPLVMDADALNIVAKDTEILRKPHTDMVLTPHMGEMARLTNNPILYLGDHRLPVCSEFAREYQVICVLKDATTVISTPYGQMHINASGTPAMATAGSGDVLTGIIASLIAQGLSATEAAPLGVYLHGLAGEYAQRSCGTHSMLASDLMHGIRMIYIERGL